MNTENNVIGELIAPETIRFSFGAPGWTLILILLLLGLLAFGLRKLYQYKKNKYRRLAIAELGLINEIDKIPSSIISQTITLLKRVALTVYDRDQLASINGLQFVQFLETKTLEKTFSEESAIIFKQSLYEGKSTKIALEQLESFHKESINWINQHRV